MGRDKPKKFSNMGYFEKERYKDEMAKKYGISGTEYRDSRGNTQTRRNDKALKAAMRNDFDYRTSAPHMDGVKGNGKFGDFTDYERSAVKLHKQAGNGGEYSSNNDITGVTNDLVNRDREKVQQAMQTKFDNRYASTKQLEDIQNSIKEQARNSKPTEISSTLTNAQEGVRGSEEDFAQQGANIFGPIGKGNDLEQATEEADSSEASGDGNDYKDKYAFNVKGGLKLSGIKTRGPNSGLNGSGFA